MTGNSTSPQYLLFVNSSEGISLHPQYDYVREHQKLEASHRTQTGNMFRYRFGEWKRWKFSISHLSLQDIQLINGWWQNNTPLHWMDGVSTPLYQVLLVNRKLPLGQHILPYTDRYRGHLELETYQPSSTTT